MDEEGPVWGWLWMSLDEAEDGMMVDGIPVRVDPQVAMYAADSIVDYVDSLWGKGLTIRLSRGSC